MNHLKNFRDTFGMSPKEWGEMASQAIFAIILASFIIGAMVLPIEFAMVLIIALVVGLASAMFVNVFVGIALMVHTAIQKPREKSTINVRRVDL